MYPPLSSDELLKQLHWLPIEWRIRFKLATLTFKPCTVVDRHISLTSCIIMNHEVCAFMQYSSASSCRHNLTFGSHAFWFCTPRVWNSLTVSIHESQSLPTFRCHLTTFHFFSQSTPFSCPPHLEYLRLRALILLRLWRYISHLLTHLLTYFHLELRSRRSGGRRPDVLT